MSNNILSSIGSSSLMTITLNGLATNAGRQSTLIAQSSPVTPRARIFVAVMAGGSAPSANAIVELRIIAGNSQIRSDLCGASDAAYPSVNSIRNSNYLGTLIFPASPAANTDQLIAEFIADRLGKEWGVAVYNLCGQSLGGNLILTPDFAADANWTKGTGWTISGGTANAAAGSASDLSQTAAPLTSGRVYRVQYTVSSRTAGTVTPKCGTQAGTAQNSNATFTELIVANGTAFLFSKDSSFDGKIDDVTVSGNFVAYEYENDQVQ